MFPLAIFGFQCELWTYPILSTLFGVVFWAIHVLPDFPPKCLAWRLAAREDLSQVGLQDFASPMVGYETRMSQTPRMLTQKMFATWLVECGSFHGLSEVMILSMAFFNQWPNKTWTHSLAPLALTILFFPRGAGVAAWNDVSHRSPVICRASRNEQSHKCSATSAGKKTRCVCAQWISPPLEPLCFLDKTINPRRCLSVYLRTFCWLTWAASHQPHRTEWLSKGTLLWTRCPWMGSIGGT